MQLSGKKLTTAILVGLMGATMFGGSVFAEVTDAQFHNEATVRDAADKALQKNITNEATVRDAADKTLQKNITNEATARTAADTKLQSSVDANAKAISAEVTARTDADKQLNTKVTNGFATIQGQQDEQDAQIAKNKKDIQTNAGNIQNNTDAIKANSDKLADHEGRIAGNEKNIETNAESIKKETNNRIDADTALQKNIDKEASDRAAADSQLNTKMNNGFATIQGQQDEQDAKIAKNQKDIQTNAGNIQNNTDAIKANSDKLDNHEERIASNEKNIETNVESIKKETNDRIDAVNGLQTNIDEVSGQVDALQKDSATVKEGAALINANKDAIEKVGSEAQTRDAADRKLQKNIDAEATARDQAVAQERAERKGADAAQDKVIQQVNQNVANGFDTLNKNIGTITDQLNKNDLAEQNARVDADKTLQNQIANNAQAIGTTKDGNYVKSNNSVGQNLNALDDQVGQNSANINQLFSDYSSMKTDINKVGARSAALAGLHPLDFDPANKLNFAVASGSFKGENSVALGAFYRPNENIMFSVASTMGDSDNAYTFGLSFKIGPSSAKTKTTSPDAEELYKVVGELQDQLAAQQKEIEQLKANKAK